MLDRRRGQDGQTELVIVFPVAMLLILLLIQGALWFLARSVAADAARDGARAAALVGGSQAAGSASAGHVLAQLSGGLMSKPRVSVDVSGGRARVTVTGVAESILPGWSMAVAATAAQPVEEFRP